MSSDFLPIHISVRTMASLLLMSLESANTFRIAREVIGNLDIGFL